MAIPRKSPVPRKWPPLHAAGFRRCLHFGKCAFKRQLVPSRTSAGLGEQKATQAIRGPLGAAESARTIPPPILNEPANAEATSEVAILAGGCFWGVQGGTGGPLILRGRAHP